MNTLAAIVGVTDITPFIMGLTQAAGTLTPLNVAAGAILISAASNNIVKGIFAYSMADRKTGRQSLAFLVGLAIAGPGAAGVAGVLRQRVSGVSGASGVSVRYAPGAKCHQRSHACVWHCGFNRLRKKPERKANSAKDGLAGAKARLILLTLSARDPRAAWVPRPCPCYKALVTKPLGLSFFAAC